MMDMVDYGPSDKKLIDDYLLPKISGNKRVVASSFVHDADVYSDHPSNLTRKHEPAAVGDDGRIWYFFSRARYVGGKSASRRPGFSRQRKWTVVGADGKKKGTWNPRRTKHVVEGSAAGGYFRRLTYQETTPAGVTVRTGWMMVEYSVADEHGGGEIVLCKVYKSGSGATPSSPAGKRKADAVEHPDEAPTTSARRRLEMDMDDDAMSFAQTLESELMCCFEIEDSPGGELAAPELPEHQEQPDTAMPPPCSARPEEAAATCVQPSRRGSVADEDDDDVMEISVEEFMCSSAPAESSPDKLVVGSSPERGSSSLSALIDDYSDDEVLACPPMDDDHVKLITSEAFVQFDPSFILEFISDD